MSCSPPALSRAIQDMGAAGLTCSTCETAARGGTGIEIDLAKVPQRAPDMTPYEILLSESQERMLIIVHKGCEEEVKRIFDKWDLPWAEVGEVTGDGMMVVKNHGEVIATVPAAKLADDAPIYHREAREPAYLAQTRALRLDDIPALSDPRAALARAAWLADDCVEKLGVPPVRPHGSRRHGTQPGLRCGGHPWLARRRTSAPMVFSAPDAPTDGIPVKFLAMTVDCQRRSCLPRPVRGQQSHRRRGGPGTLSAPGRGRLVRPII